MAILWHELWHEGLEEASRLYFGDRNVRGMFSTLEPLHAMIERGPQTLKETSFTQVGKYSLASLLTLKETSLTQVGKYSLASLLTLKENILHKG